MTFAWPRRCFEPMAELRFGLGFDVHPREDDRPLALGGLRWDGEPGLAGHSDGDVVCHALADALLGAAGLGDLGVYFPESDPELAGMAGSDLVRRTVGLIREAGFDPDHCDVTLVAHRPAIDPRREEVRGVLARAMDVEPGRVSVKATRPEGLGLTGDGAACLAVAAVRARG
jgi:2-C-methyl-D-erythritol 2,4-cyclodiphosphate synthase